MEAQCRFSTYLTEKSVRSFAEKTISRLLVRTFKQGVHLYIALEGISLITKEHFVEKGKKKKALEKKQQQS